MTVTNSRFLVIGNRELKTDEMWEQAVRLRLLEQQLWCNIMRGWIMLLMGRVMKWMKMSCWSWDNILGRKLRHKWMHGDQDGVFFRYQELLI